MDITDLRASIETELQKRHSKVVNRNAVSALFSAFSDPMGSLGKIFVGRGDALDAERQRIAVDTILELLARIDNAITEAGSKAQAHGITLSGLIETTAAGATSVVGVQISQDAGSVTIAPGTHIKTDAIGSVTVVGLKVG